ncbi:hypothetical protein J4G07_22220 [Candidatus Poribacteria bacterium]|nr:hypothetical protein [Candidatus Poribacteria bacterium]
MEDIRLLPVMIGTRAMHDDLPEDDDDKYWVRITASNAELDRHNSIMDPKTTLKNFEADAKSALGVALKDHHAWRSFGYGRSSDAQLTDKNELLIDFFILRNMEYNGSGLYFTSSEQLIRAIENDLVNQASVGFYGAREICNLCNLPIRRYSYWDWEPEREGQCTHKMGKIYEDKNGKMKPATYTVYDARLKEVSLVEFGSNRKTSIDTKREFDELGRHIETLCRTTSKTCMEEFLMTDQEWITKLRDALEIPTVKSTDEPDAVVQKLQEEVTTLRSDLETEKDKIATMTETHKTELAALEADAEDGKAYRQARVDEAIKQGNRAYGDDFDEEYHREYYSDMPLEKLETHIAQNKKKADTALPAGRSTTDDHEPPPENEKVGMRQRQRRMRRRIGRVSAKPF